MQTLVKYLLLLNLALFLVNDAMFWVGRPEAKMFTVRAQMIVAVLAFVSFLVYRRPNSMAWFGSKLDVSHEANATVSYAVSLFLLVVPLILNAGPMLIAFGIVS